MLLAGPTRAEPPRAVPDRTRVEPGEDAAAGARARSRSPARVGTARRGRRPAPRPSRATRGSARPDARTSAGILRRRARSARASRRASATVTSTRSAGPPPSSVSTDSVTSSPLPAARPSTVSIAVWSAAVRTPFASPSSTIVSRELASAFGIGEERAGAELHVEHQRVGAFGDLLRHDRRRDERDRLDRAGDIAQRVELVVGRREAGARGRDHATDRAQHVAHLVGRQVGAPAGDRFHLVERAAGVAEAAPRQLRHRGAARGDERHEDERDLVADAAGRVLVDGRPADCRTGRAARPTRSSPRSTS